MSQPNVIDESFVTEQIRASWFSWTGKQKHVWLAFHGFMPMQYSRKYDDLPVQVKDALFTEFLDVASKDFEYDRDNTLRQDF